MRTTSSRPVHVVVLALLVGGLLVAPATPALAGAGRDATARATGTGSEALRDSKTGTGSETGRQIPTGAGDRTGRQTRTPAAAPVLDPGPVQLERGPAQLASGSAQLGSSPAQLEGGPAQSERGTRSAVFAVRVPTGGRLRLLPAGDVLVEDSRGKAVGAYDAPWASDALGRPLPTSYRIDGARLVQTVELTPRTRFPVTLDPIYSPVERGADRDAERSQTVDDRRAVGSDEAAGAAGEPAAGTGPDVGADPLAARPSRVRVPAAYVYNPRLGVLHDYCTASPDEFPAPGATNADFRGPCARHDLCYAGSTSEFTCDNQLLRDMYRNCAHWYYRSTALRTSCRATALLYWAAVVAI